MTTTRTWLVIAAGLLLGGCSAGSRPVFPHHYALPATPPAAQASTTAPARGTLRIARIDAPSWLADTAMYYRLAYRHDHRIAAYAQSDWVEPPTGMLATLIRATLTDSSPWRVVIGPGNPAASDASLHLQLNDFSQVFSQPGQSHAVLDASATLVDDDNDRALAQKHFHVRVAASSADAAGGVQALGRAGRQFAARLRSWLRTVAAHRAHARAADHS